MKILIPIIIFLTSYNSFSQKELDIFITHIRNSNYKRAELTLQEITDSDLKKELKIHLNILTSGDFYRNKENTYIKIDTSSTAYNFRLINEALRFYFKEGHEVKAFNTLEKSLNLSKKRNNIIIICLSLQYILEIYERFHIVINDNSYSYFIQEYKKYARNDFEKKICALYEYRIIQRYFYNSPDKVIPYYAKSKVKLEKIKAPIFSVKRDLTHFTHHIYYTKNYDSCQFYISRAIAKIGKLNGYFEKERLEAIKINKAILELNLETPQEALKTLNSINLTNDDYIYKLLKKYVYYWKHKSYAAIGNKVESLNAHNQYLQLEIKGNQAKNLQMVSEYVTKYQTAEKEKKIVQLLNTNLKSEANRVRNRNLFIGAISFIVIGLVIAFLVYKNSKRKQRIVEQQHEIELQKTEKLLKEQELSAIDAMILGQEKERQRLANDLHDNLGSTLATVKLHFQHLRNNKDNPKITDIEELYSKTDNLLEEAYQKVRTIAHEKNNGVMANQGLLLAIKNLAKKVSNGNLLVEVQDYGLEQRLDNALEITIFRMIQELITNAIKHAKATEIHISLTNHDSLLNIIVEDNGKGFDAKVLPKKEGMGLATIEKRVEHLEGTFEIDSTIGKGTNIIINIPI